jgi:hypothetical protein
VFIFSVILNETTRGETKNLEWGDPTRNFFLRIERANGRLPLPIVPRLLILVKKTLLSFGHFPLAKEKTNLAKSP